mmetsp:Transcript_10980/g.39727  ORF Transcript_10980/g.39727 Transcript_10980/m.39727 type:complete len:230 (+) Transcript_10980:499-1188(+)
MSIVSSPVSSPDLLTNSVPTGNASASAHSLSSIPRSDPNSSVRPRSFVPQNSASPPLASLAASVFPASLSNNRIANDPGSCDTFRTSSSPLGSLGRPAPYLRKISCAGDSASSPSVAMGSPRKYTATSPSNATLTRGDGATNAIPFAPAPKTTSSIFPLSPSETRSRSAASSRCTRSSSSAVAAGMKLPDVLGPSTRVFKRFPPRASRPDPDAKHASIFPSLSRRSTRK